ncbi:MAG: hypothetical protein IJ060_01165 [Oscillospiraceae bacterium]|nr:hypothetical protein [Oscillospiraceae bacterium]
MLGSDYRELIVPKTDNTLQKALILIGGGALTVVLLLFSLISGYMLMLFLAAGAGFGTWYLWTSKRIEYEYVIAGDELNITKILAQSRRKPMMAVSIKKFTAFGKLPEAEGGESLTTVLACSAQDENAYYADFEHESLGNTRLIWTPNDDILEYLSKHMPRNLGYRFYPREEQ